MPVEEIHFFSFLVSAASFNAANTSAKVISPVITTASTGTILYFPGISVPSTVKVTSPGVGGCGGVGLVTTFTTEPLSTCTPATGIWAVIGCAGSPLVSAHDRPAAAHNAFASANVLPMRFGTETVTGGCGGDCPGVVCCLTHASTQVPMSHAWSTNPM